MAVQHIYLKPGELCLSRQPVLVTTVLGSCVSLSLYHRQTGTAAICHAMQPRCPQVAACPRNSACAARCSLCFRYTECAVSAMLSRMAKFSIRPAEMEAKLFGGASLIGHGDRQPDACGTGKQNVQVAMQSMSHHGLAPKVTDVGGVCGRKIIFDSTTGDVFVKKLHRIGALAAS